MYFSYQLEPAAKGKQIVGHFENINSAGTRQMSVITTRMLLSVLPIPLSSWGLPSFTEPAPGHEVQLKKSVSHTFMLASIGLPQNRYGWSGDGTGCNCTFCRMRLRSERFTGNPSKYAAKHLLIFLIQARFPLQVLFTCCREDLLLVAFVTATFKAWLCISPKGVTTISLLQSQG